MGSNLFAMLKLDSSDNRILNNGSAGIIPGSLLRSSKNPSHQVMIL